MRQRSAATAAPPVGPSRVACEQQYVEIVTLDVWDICYCVYVTFAKPTLLHLYQAGEFNDVCQV